MAGHALELTGPAACGLCAEGGNVRPGKASPGAADGSPRGPAGLPEVRVPVCCGTGDGLRDPAAGGCPLCGPARHERERNALRGRCEPVPVHVKAHPQPATPDPWTHTTDNLRRLLHSAKCTFRPFDAHNSQLTPRKIPTPRGQPSSSGPSRHAPPDPHPADRSQAGMCAQACIWEAAGREHGPDAVGAPGL